MRSKLTQTAIVATTLLSVAGCKSGPGWKWWGSKENTSAEALVNAPGAPQLPSASATAAGTPSLNAAAPSMNASGMTAAGMTSATGGMAPAYADQPAAATAYPQNYPATQTAEYTNPYTGGAAAMTAAATAPSAAGQPQQGPYSPVYPTGTQTNPYATAGGNPYAGNPQMPASDPYRSPQQPPATDNYADPNYRGSDQGYRTADSRSATSYDGGPNQADRRYEPPTDYRDDASTPDYTRPSGGAELPNGGGAAAPAASRYSDSYQPGTTDYQPGASEYTPGNTGYTGPRSYEQPAGGGPAGAPAGAIPNAAPGSAEPRRDPGYRPAGTSDYMPAGPRAGGSASAGFSTSSTSTGKSGVVTAGYAWPNGDRDAAVPARFVPEDSEPSSASPVGRRSYE